MLAIILLFLVGCSLLLIGCRRYLRYSGNFHEVVPGTLYRSAQLTTVQLEKYQQQVGIRSMINLLGDRSGKPWYEDQKSAAKTLGIEHFDFAIPLRQHLPRERAVALADLMRRAPKPVLIHCKVGADRSGLAAALYLSMIEDLDATRASRALSWRYGHLGLLPASSSYAIAQTWKAYQTWLR